MDNQVELHDDDQEIVEAQVNADAGTEEQSIAAAVKAGGATGSAKKRKGDKSNGEGMTTVKKEDYDFSEDLDALVNGEATLSEEFKEKTAIIFEAAIKSKVAQEIDRLEEQYTTKLDEEVATIRSELVEKVDSYLSYVVESWMEENRVAIQQGLRTEIAEDFMGKLHALFTESYIEVPESKVDLVDELAEQVESLEGQLNAATEKAMSMSEELEALKRAVIISEAAEGLAATEVEKLHALVEDLDFESEGSFAKKVKTVKESYFKKDSVVTSQEIVEEIDADATVEVSSSMEKYLTAIRRVNKQ